MYRKVALLQAVYMLVTGLWPLVSMGTFIAVTGPKVDLWLVEMVGCLSMALGTGLLVACYRNTFDTPLLVTIIAGSLAFMVIDVTYALKDVIFDIYLADAFAELIFVSAHVWRLAQQERAV